MIKSINFTGAQGTGKTSVLRELKGDPLFKDSEFVSEVVRNFVKERNLRINRDGTVETQKLLFEAYKEVLGKTAPYVSDRCIIDVAAYTEAGRNGIPLGSKGRESFGTLGLEQLAEIFSRKDDFGLVFYFPIEFDIVADGVRSIDLQYQKEIDENILKILTSCEIPFVKMHGSVEERVEQIKAALYSELTEN